MPAESLFGDECGNRDDEWVRRTWTSGVFGYARTEVNMSKGTKDNGAEDRGDKDDDRDALNGGQGWRTVAAADGVARISQLIDNSRQEWQADLIVHLRSNMRAMYSLSHQHCCARWHKCTIQCIDACPGGPTLNVPNPISDPNFEDSSLLRRSRIVITRLAREEAD